MDIDRFLNEEELRQLADVIAEMEESTSGEIRVRVVDTYDPTFFDTVKDRALTEFVNLGMGNTRDKTGVLILIALKERQFYVVADEGINNRLPAYSLNNHAQMMSDDFKRGNFQKGLESMIRYIGKQLAQHFPPREDDTNELSNDIVVGD